MNKRESFTDLRKQKGSQEYVAEELGISKVYLRMIENGTFKPGRDLMIRISKYFEQPLEVLFPDIFEKN